MPRVAAATALPETEIDENPAFSTSFASSASCADTDMLQSGRSRSSRIMADGFMSSVLLRPFGHQLQVDIISIDFVSLIDQ